MSRWQELKKELTAEEIEFQNQITVKCTLYSSDGGKTWSVANQLSSGPQAPKLKQVGTGSSWQIYATRPSVGAFGKLKNEFIDFDLKGPLVRQ